MVPIPGWYNLRHLCGHDQHSLPGLYRKSTHPAPSLPTHLALSNLLSLLEILRHLLVSSIPHDRLPVLVADTRRHHRAPVHALPVWIDYWRGSPVWHPVWHAANRSHVVHAPWAAVVRRRSLHLRLRGLRLRLSEKSLLILDLLCMHRTDTGIGHGRAVGILRRHESIVVAVDVLIGRRVHADVALHRVVELLLWWAVGRRSTIGVVVGL